MAVKARTWEPTTHVAGQARLDMARATLPKGQFRAVPAKNTGESGLKPQPSPSAGQSRRLADSLRDGRSTTSRLNGTNGLPTSSDGLSGLNYGIDRANPTSCRAWMSVGGPAMVALQHGGRRSARTTQRVACNGRGKGKGRSRPRRATRQGVTQGDKSL